MANTGIIATKFGDIKVEFYPEQTQLRILEN
jgi:hypothetical protein